MKRFFFLFLLLLVLCSCEEEAFVEMDPARFNISLKARTDVKTPKQVMEMFYDYSPKGTPKGIKITTKSLGSEQYKITLIHDPIEAGGQVAWKLVMLADESEGYWRATKIMKSWKCEEGKGHKGWGIGKCK